MPHYFAARLRVFSSIEPDTIVLNSGSSEQFYASLRSHDTGPANVIDIKASQANDIFEKISLALSEQTPDVVVLAGWSTVECFAGLLWARRNGKRVVMMSESQQSDAHRSRLREAFKSRIIGACDTALVGGRRHQEYIVSLGMPIKNVFLGYDAVDNQYFEKGADRARADCENERRRLGLPVRYLLASSRFIPKKNLARLIKAFAKAIKSLPDAPDLVLLGDGPERGSIEAAILENEIAGRVHLMGLQPYDSLPSFYGLSEGFVHVSTSEQWGLVINEAAASGLPLVVSAPCGATPELVHEGVNGWVVDPLNVEDMTLALSRLISMQLSERSAMGNASRRIATEWGPERFAHGLAAACIKAQSHPTKRLMLWDRLLVRILSTRQINTVA